MTAVEYLVSMICTDVNVYDEEGNDNGVEYWNAFTSCKDLSKYINIAKEMEKQQQNENKFSNEEMRFIEGMISFYWMHYNIDHLYNFFENELSNSIIKKINYETTTND